jgi:hypothetical protein
MKLIIEQLALCPENPAKAKALLAKLGITDWIDDKVQAAGEVYGEPVVNVANLAFNYQASPQQLELELLHYTAGNNWMMHNVHSASHLGMHCTEADLVELRKLFAAENIPVVQEVKTLTHSNPAIAGKRAYQYVIFGTRPILGIDLKFIVRFILS